MPNLTSEELAEMTKDFPFPDGLTDEQCIEKLAEFPDEPKAKDVAVLFQALGLEQYTAAFREEGYDDSFIMKALEDDELEEDDDVMSVESFYVFKARRGAASGHESESRHCSLTARRLSPRRRSSSRRRRRQSSSRTHRRAAL